MWTIDELKQRGKASFKANYWKCVLCAFLLWLFNGGIDLVSRRSDYSSSFNAMMQQMNALPGGNRLANLMIVLVVLAVTALFTGVGIIIKVFLTNPLQVGCLHFFVKNTQAPPVELDTLGLGFRQYWHTVVTLFLTDLFIFLWTLLLIIPGIVKSYSYRMVPYILAEHPEMPPKEIIARSCKMMDGHKWHSFVLDLSFIGWYLLSIFTLGILNLFWTEPYKRSTEAALYLKLRGETDHAFAESQPQFY